MAADFYSEYLDWSGLPSRIRALEEDGSWVFRGQLGHFTLKTTLERACERSGVSLRDAPSIESEMAREFQRWYDGTDREEVRSDMLYCLALMQHHGSPTRLLDWTYSGLIALYFALEMAQDYDSASCLAVWCLNQDWLYKKTKAIAGSKLVRARRTDDRRNDETFRALYMAPYPFRFVYLENPYFFSTRLFMQQGLFACPGDVSLSFEENLRSLSGWNRKSAVVKLCCPMDTSSRQDAFAELRRLNIYRGVLFPGLDGFAQGMKYRLELYEKLVDWRKRRGP